MYLLRTLKFFLASWRYHLRKRKENTLAQKLFNQMRLELTVHPAVNVMQMKHDLKEIQKLIHRLELHKTIEKTIDAESKS